MTATQLRRYRLAYRLTRRQLAAQVGLSVQALYYYESGRRRIPEPLAKLLPLLRREEGGPHTERPFPYSGA